MICEFDEEMIERNEAIELSDRDLGSRVRLWHRTMPYNDGMPHDDAFVAMCAELSANGMTATVNGLLLDVVGGRSLPHFLDSLVNDFAGWDGIRSWESLDHELRIDAQHVHRRIRLDWILTRQSGQQTAWTATTTIKVEAGEQLRQLTAAVHRFLLPF
ncbi:DUF6228 family protein [Nocardia sp. NPDC052566]|uniref:DUF6228 family protein n=1 Tax=Nocardia sp. NPDC052566 TaxID=3364330 RepID=UPI0037CA0913